MSAYEHWRVVAGEFKDTKAEVRVVLRNAESFVGVVAAHPNVSTLLHLERVEPNAVTPTRPHVTLHRIDWSEIVAMSGTGS